MKMRYVGDHEPWKDEIFDTRESELLPPFRDIYIPVDLRPTYNNSLSDDNYWVLILPSDLEPVKLDTTPGPYKIIDQGTGGMMLASTKPGFDDICRFYHVREGEVIFKQNAPGNTQMICDALNMASREVLVEVSEFYADLQSIDKPGEMMMGLLKTPVSTMRGLDEYRAVMVEVAAIAIKTIESIDARGAGTPPGPPDHPAPMSTRVG